MNTNENPYPPSMALARNISERVLDLAQSLNRYPDRDAVQLRSELANYLNRLSASNLNYANIWAANGSNEIIQTLFLAFGGSGALGFVPSYSMHALIAKVTSSNWVEGKRKADFSLDLDLAKEEIARVRPSMTFITTPNNPTGTAVSIDVIENLARSTQQIGGMLLVDEAYAEFSTQTSALSLIENYPNVVVIRTMSKAFAFAGARIGYMAADPRVIDAVQLVRLPYHLSQVTQALGLAALEHSAELLENVHKLIEARQEVAHALLDLGCEVITSEANFILFSVKDPRQVWSSLLERGVLIRDVGLPGYLRVTIGTDEENQQFIQALATSISSRGGTL